MIRNPERSPNSLDSRRRGNDIKKGLVCVSSLGVYPYLMRLPLLSALNGPAVQRRPSSDPQATFGLPWADITLKIHANAQDGCVF